MSAIKKITTRAKQIRKKHPGLQWKTALKRAGAEIRTGKKTARKKVAKKSIVRKSAIKKHHAGETSVSSAISTAKRKLIHDIGTLEAKKFAATRKTEKNKIQKSITDKKRLYRKIAK